MPNKKEAAGRRGAEFVEQGMVVGLGSGTTMLFAIQRLAERVRNENLDIKCIPSSVKTEEAARRLGLPLADLNQVPGVDICIDGADEVDGNKNLIKGGGGALLREKIIMASAGDVVIVVSEEKLVEKLGKRFLLPVEVLPFGWWPASIKLKNLGCTPLLRRHRSGVQYITDNGNYILDCRFDGIDDPAGLEKEINNIPGVVENGIFVNLAKKIVVGKDEGGVEIIR